MSAIFKKKAKKTGGVLDFSDQEEVQAQESKQEEVQRKPAVVSKSSAISFDNDEIQDHDTSNVLAHIKTKARINTF